MFTVLGEILRRAPSISSYGRTLAGGSESTENRESQNGQRDQRGQGQAPTLPLYEDLIFISLASNSDPILKTLKSTNSSVAPGGCHPAPPPLL